MPVPGRGPQFSQHSLVDTTPMPDDIPKVTEIGATSAPLLSASYFIGDRCRAYNDDYMQCKTESYGRGELDCMREGRKVTRCAASVLSDINKNCLEEFRAHWDCLENKNHQLWQCRRPERKLNQCVFDKIGLQKTIPNTPRGETPVHLRQKQIYADEPQYEPGHPDAPVLLAPLKPVVEKLADYCSQRYRAKQQQHKEDASASEGSSAS